MAEVNKELTTYLPKQQSSTTSGKAVAVLLKPLIDLHGEPRNWRTAAPLYIEALADIPPDLLAVAVKHAIASNPFFPKPADLRLSIADELTAWRKRREAERLARLPPPEPVQPPSSQDIAEVDELVRKALGAITSRRAYIQVKEYKREFSEMLWLDDSDPSRMVWEACESPIEQYLCHALFAWLNCKAIPGEFRRARLPEMPGPAAYLFSQQKAARYRLDFLLVAVPENGCADWIALECDGQRFHTADEQIVADRKRDAGLEDIGIKTMRFSGSDLHSDMRGVIRRIAAWLNEAGVACEPQIGGMLAQFTPAKEAQQDRQRRRDKYWLEENQRRGEEPDFVDELGNACQWRDTL